MSNENRQPRGTPVGGQFAEGRRPAPAPAAHLRPGDEEVTVLPVLGPGEATYDRFLSAGSHTERWQVAYSAALAAWHGSDEAIETNPNRSDIGDAIDHLTTEQQSEVFRRAAKYADTDPHGFGAAVFDEAHAILDEATESYWAGRYAQSGASRQPVYTADDIRDAYADDPAKRYAMLSDIDLAEDASDPDRCQSCPHSLGNHIFEGCLEVTARSENGAIAGYCDCKYSVA